MHQWQDSITSFEIKQHFLTMVFEPVSLEYKKIVNEVLSSARELEHSLKNRNEKRGVAVASTSNSVSDTDKMQAQFHLDINELARFVTIFIIIICIHHSKSC